LSSAYLQPRRPRRVPPPVPTRRSSDLQVEGDLSIVAVVGDGMKHSPGTSGRMFSALGRNGVNVVAIAQGASERNISAVVRQVDRSEEHTSELQSRENLVCRLRLEKKKY